MKIALLTNGIFPYEIGGIAKHSYYLAKYLAKNKIYVDIYHSMPKMAKRQYIFNKEAKYIRSYEIAYPKTSFFPGHYLKEQYIYSTRIFKLLKEQLVVDLIYIQGFCGWKLIEYKKQGMPLPPIVVNLHGLEMFQRSINLKTTLEQVLLKRPATFNIKNADYLISLGGKLTDIINKISGIKNKAIEIPIGIEKCWLNKTIKPVTTKRKFVFIGRYERRKGINELNTVLADLINKYDFEFHFIGPIPKNKHIISEKIIYHDVIKNEEKIKKILHNSDILVCPSYSEGMPTVILEGMASGLAIIATDVGAVDTLISSKNGWLIKPVNIKKELKQAIIDAISIPAEVLTKKKQNALKFVKDNLLWDKVIQDTIHSIKKEMNS